MTLQGCDRPCWLSSPVWWWIFTVVLVILAGPCFSISFREFIDYRYLVDGLVSSGCFLMGIVMLLAAVYIPGLVVCDGDASNWLPNAPEGLCHAIDTVLHPPAEVSESIENAATVSLATSVFVTSMVASEVAMPLATMGYQILTWSAGMAVTKWILPSLCDRAGSEGTAINGATLAQQTGRTLSAVIDTSRDGKIFTSKVTQDLASKKGCVQYPIKQAEWCHRLGHNHRVPASFQDPNFSELREMNIKLIWQKMQQDNAMDKLIASSDVCKWSVQDALCLDAFPLCDTSDLTPCSLACRNVKGCFHDLFGSGNTEKSEERLKSYVEQCGEMCKISTGMDTQFDPSKVIAESRLQPTISALTVPHQSSVQASIALGVAFAFAAIGLRMWRRLATPQPPYNLVSDVPLQADASELDVLG